MYPSHSTLLSASSTRHHNHTSEPIQSKKEPPTSSTSIQSDWEVERFELPTDSASVPYFDNGNDPAIGQYSTKIEPDPHTESTPALRSDKSGKLAVKPVSSDSESRVQFKTFPAINAAATESDIENDVRNDRHSVLPALHLGGSFGMNLKLLSSKASTAPETRASKKAALEYMSLQSSGMQET